ncbi:hypothetical protein MN608_09825 [Microdochium nivale]|nr:hypothetical protein MN608_09825 [Microdochium nivale]
MKNNEETAVVAPTTAKTFTHKAATIIRPRSLSDGDVDGLPESCQAQILQQELKDRKELEDKYQSALEALQKQQKCDTVSTSTAAVQTVEPAEAFELQRLANKIEVKDAVIGELAQAIARLAALA